MKKWLPIVCVLVLVAGVWAADSASKGGVLKVATQGMVVTLKVIRPDAKKPIEVPIPSGRDASLPAGTYDIAKVQLYKPDAKGKMWCLNAISDLGKLRTLSLAQGETTTVEGGETLKVRTQSVVTHEKPPKVVKGMEPVGPPPPTATIVTVYLDYVGQSGEHYGPKAMLGSAPIQTKPVIRIKDENDKVLSEGTYNFGSQGYGGFG